MQWIKALYDDAWYLPTRMCISKQQGPKILGLDSDTSPSIWLSLKDVRFTSQPSMFGKMRMGIWWGGTFLSVPMYRSLYWDWVLWFQQKSWNGLSPSPSSNKETVGLPAVSFLSAWYCGLYCHLWCKLQTPLTNSRINQHSIMFRFNAVFEERTISHIIYSISFADKLMGLHRIMTIHMQGIPN